MIPLTAALYLCRECPALATMFLPLIESWHCALCASADLKGFGVFRVTRFSVSRFGGRQDIAFFLCGAHRGTPLLEVEDAISRSLEGEPPVTSALTLFLGSAQPRPT